MKKIILIFLLFFWAKLAACSCADTSLAVEFQESDMVARVKIISEQSTKHKGVIKYRLQVLEQYKGKPSQVLYYSTMAGTSCESSLDKNTEMIIFAIKDETGNYSMGPCSKTMRLSNDKKGLQEKQEAIQLLHLLKKNTLPALDSALFDISQHALLKGLSASDFKRNFAVFELEFNEDGQVKNIKTQISFGRKADKQAKAALLKTKQRKEKGIPFHRKGLLVLSYYQHSKTFYLAPY